MAHTTRTATTPPPAEVVRTLVRGRLPGVLRIPGAPPLTSPHSTDRAGRPLVLARDGDDLSRALSAWDSPGDPPVRLSVADIPPLAGAPGYGQARIAGRIHRLPPTDAAVTAHEFAEAHPATDLLDIGHGVSMHLIEVDQVILERGRARWDIPVADYTTAEPDPLHELESDLLCDLADHHATQVEGYFRFLLALAGVPCCPYPPRAVRLDRYGFVADIGGSSSRWVRLNFHRPVQCRHELAHLLHPVLFHQSPPPIRGEAEPH